MEKEPGAKAANFHYYYDAAQYRTDKWNELKLATVRRERAETAGRDATHYPLTWSVDADRLELAARTARSISDHAADGVLAREDLARDAAALVQLLERDRLLVGGDLEDGVGRRVDDPLARPAMLLSMGIQDGRSGAGPSQSE